MTRGVRIKAAIVLLLMAAAFAGAKAWRPTHHMADTRAKIDLETLFPKAFADWRTDDRMPVQLISPDIQAVLNKIYNQTLSRTYVNPEGERIMLSVAYGGDQSDATRAHRPEVCYPAQGFQLLGSSTSSVRAAGRDIKVRRLVAQSGGRIEPITYWVITGSDISLTGTEQKLTQLKYTLRGVIPDGMLVRVSSIESNRELAYSEQASFIAAMSAALPASYRDRVIGAVAGTAKAMQ